MKTIAKTAGLNLSQERIERDLTAFKNFLSDFDAMSNVTLALEDEPGPVFRLRRGQK
jgi:hypothetical protein